MLRVVSARTYACNPPVPVFDLTVETHHNFQLACGAVVANSHIECLLLGHFFRHFRPLVEGGRVYVGLPPLYRATVSGKHTYLRDDDALAEYMRGRASSVVGGSEELLALAGVASRVVDLFVTRAGEVGIGPRDFSMVLGGLVHHVAEGGSAEDGLTEGVTNRLIEICEGLGFEGLDAVQLGDGVFSVSGLDPATERYATMVITEEVVQAASDAFSEVAELVGEDAAMALCSDAPREISGARRVGIYDVAAAIDSESRRGITLTRLKGLGEMQDVELGETTLDPRTRRLIQIRVTDFGETGEFIGNLLRKDGVEPRRRLIQSTRLGREQVDA